jgi:hypothetical protein
MWSSSCAKSPKSKSSLSPPLLLQLVPSQLLLLQPLVLPLRSQLPRSNLRTFSKMWLPERKQRAAA